MKIWRTFTALAALPICIGVSSAQALPLSDFNLILSGDYSYQGSAVWGHSAIGGNLLGGGGEFGTRLPRDTSDDSLIVVGDIRSSNINLQAGNLVHGGTINGTTIANNGRGSVRQDQSLNIDPLIAELVDASNLYSSRASTGTYQATSNAIKFNYSGAGEVAYFSVDAADLFAQNNNIQINSGNAKTAIINVAGKNVTAAGGINFGQGFGPSSSGFGASNVLWNFYEAETLDLGNFGFIGSILAIGANISQIGTLDGSLAARSLIGNRQIHNEYFDAPPEVPEVPLPPSIQMMLGGLGLMAFLRWKRRRA